MYRGTVAYEINQRSIKHSPTFQAAQLSRAKSKAEHELATLEALYEREKQSLGVGVHFMSLRGFRLHDENASECFPTITVPLGYV